MTRILRAMGLLDRIVPADALSGFAHVGWRKVDQLDDQVRRGEVLAASGGLCWPAGTVTSQWGVRGWDDRHGWVRWPSVNDLLPVFTAPRGAVVYASLPPQHGRTRRCSPERPCRSLNALHMTMWGECYVIEERDHARR